MLCFNNLCMCNGSEMDTILALRPDVLHCWPGSEAWAASLIRHGTPTSAFLRLDFPSCPFSIIDAFACCVSTICVCATDPKWTQYWHCAQMYCTVGPVQKRGPKLDVKMFRLLLTHLGITPISFDCMCSETAFARSNIHQHGISISGVTYGAVAGSVRANRL